MTTADRKEDLDVPVRWTWPFTIGDSQQIEALGEDFRAVVERYVRSRGVSPSDQSEYERGWEDGAEAAVETMYAPPPPRVHSLTGSRSRAR